MRILAGRPPKGCSRSNRCQASCNSSATCHHSSTDTTHNGYRSDYEESYKVSSVPPPLEAFAILGLNRIRHHNALTLYTK